MGPLPKEADSMPKKDIQCDKFDLPRGWTSRKTRPWTKSRHTKIRA